MPLINKPSKAARQKNIEREIAAGKDPKQAVAIGYAVQRRAAAKHHKPSFKLAELGRRR